MNVLKQARVNWSIKYLRKCLEERYKDPAHRKSALLRHKREGPAGTAPDTDLTPEELEARLTPGQDAARRVFGEYTVKFNMVSKSNKPYAPFITHRSKEDNLHTSILPLVIKVNAAEQNAVAWVDTEEYVKMLEQGADYRSKANAKTRVKEVTTTVTTKERSDGKEQT